MSLTHTQTLHGVFLNIAGVGTLLTGASGIGKSEIALQLIHQGNHQLIADDAPEFNLQDARLIGQCPALLQDFLAVQGLGVLNIRQLFGNHAICSKAPLELIIELRRLTKISGEALIHGYPSERTILGVVVPQITLPYRPYRPMAVMVECAVRNHLLNKQGYFSSHSFQQQHRQALS
ncbi:MAG: hypothetical protein HWD59_11030 [Coxiellaceae bacterium]|nr:MAG: hypothetical protein HWD59_11030 [Coxiellaceae bacterium]